MDSITNNKFQYFLVFLVILISANAAIFINDEFVFIVFVLTFLAFLNRKSKVDPIFVYITFVWAVINLLSYLHNNTSLDYITFIGFILKFSYPYFIIKLVGPTFLDKLRRVIYILTLISLPIFLIQLLYPDLFYALAKYINIITRDEQKIAGGWYSGFYMFNVWGDFRNSGFMWEPGAFALMISLAMVLHINKYGIRLTKEMSTYILAMVSTLSTMGYMVLFILLLIFIYKTKRISLFIILIPILYFFVTYVLSLDFVIPEIKSNLSNIYQLHVPVNTEYQKLNRIGFFIYAFNQALIWPLGYGVVQSRAMSLEYHGDLEGVGTLSYILIYWGWIGFLIFFIAIKKLIKLIQINNDSILLIFSIIIIIVAFFSNPMQKNPIMYCLFFYPFIFRGNYETIINNERDRFIQSKQLAISLKRID